MNLCEVRIEFGLYAVFTPTVPFAVMVAVAFAVGNRSLV